MRSSRSSVDRGERCCYDNREDAGARRRNIDANRRRRRRRWRRRRRRRRKIDSGWNPNTLPKYSLPHRRRRWGMTRRIVGIETMRISSLPPPSSPSRHSHKPKREAYSTKQQRRQHQRLTHHLLQGEGVERPPSMTTMTTAANTPPKLLQRAWSTLPVEGGGGVWHHSLKSQLD
jgi:hypothetical protein